ncbi:MAG TPA: hypothetical protein VE270_04320, partial [Thermoleophilaceae bacterium]|nr:hypothetical protein [Thermoleophilaceae bacterium]
MSFLGTTPRSRRLSAAGEASLADVLPHLPPDPAAALGRQGVEAETRRSLISLVGLAAFCGVEQRVRAGAASAGEDEGTQGSTPHAVGVFWPLVGSFAAGNLVVGHVRLHREEAGLAPGAGRDRRGSLGLAARPSAARAARTRPLLRDGRARACRAVDAHGFGCGQVVAGDRGCLGAAGNDGRRPWHRHSPTTASSAGRRRRTHGTPAVRLDQLGRALARQPLLMDVVGLDSPV